MRLCGAGGVWVDVVTYFKDADLSLPGAPSASPCEHYLRILYQEYGELDLTCTVTAPERLAVNGNGDGYTPELFPVLCNVRNTGSEQHRDGHGVGRAKGHRRILEKHERHRHRERGQKHEQEHAERTLPVRPGQPRLRR